MARQLLEFYPEPNYGAGGLTNNHLALQNRVVNKNQLNRCANSSGAVGSRCWSARSEYLVAAVLRP